MSKTYFKHRGRFDFSPHRYEIGNPITQNKRLDLGHFLNEHTGDEETFFYHVKDITLKPHKTL
jgi:hypothetical protein